MPVSLIAWFVMCGSKYQYNLLMLVFAGLAIFSLCRLKGNGDPYTFKILPCRIMMILTFSFFLLCFFTMHGVTHPLHHSMAFAFIMCALQLIFTIIWLNIYCQIARLVSEHCNGVRPAFQ